MSITKDFERRGEYVDIKGASRYIFSNPDINQLLKHTRALETKLKENEWKYDSELADYWCLECAGMKPNHEPGCEVAKLLKGVE